MDKAALMSRCINYALKVECDRCGCEVYPTEEHAREYVEGVFEDEDEIKSVEDFLSYLERTCDYCDHIMTKDD